MADFDLIGDLNKENTQQAVLAALNSIGTVNSIHTDTQVPPAPMLASADFTGSEWLDSQLMGHAIYLMAGTELFDTVEIEWSDDGVSANGSVTDLENAPTAGFNVHLWISNTFVSGRYWRAHVINGAVDQSVAQIGVASSGKDPYMPLIGVNDDINIILQAFLTRSIIAGDLLSEDMLEVTGFGNAQLTTDGSQIIASPPRRLFKDTYEDSGAFPSGATPAFDAIGPIVASNVKDTGWLPAARFNNQFFNMVFDVAGIRAFLLNASDDQGNNSPTVDFSAPNAVSVGFNFPAPIGSPFFSDYFRLIIINDSGSASNGYSIRSQGLDQPVSPLYLGLDQPIFDFYTAPLQQSVTKGRQPDGDYVATPSDGNADSYNTPLAAAGSVTLGPFDTDGYKSIEVYIATDQVSATDGIEIEYTPDAGAGVPAYFPGPMFTFGADEVTNGFAIKRFAPAMDGFRITYTNGGTLQGSFLLDMTLRTAQTENPSLSLEDTIDSTQANVATRGAIYAENTEVPGTYSNVDQTGGGLHVSVENFGAGVPIGALTAFETGGTTVSTTAVQIATGLNADTKTVSIKADQANNKQVHVGANSGVTTANGYPLNAGDAVEIEVNESTDIWCISSAGGQTVYWLAVNTDE